MLKASCVSPIESATTERTDGVAPITIGEFEIATCELPDKVVVARLLKVLPFTTNTMFPSVQSVEVPTPPPPPPSTPSQSPVPPVIPTQKSESTVPTVPNRLKRVATVNLEVEAFLNVDVAVVLVAVMYGTLTSLVHIDCKGRTVDAAGEALRVLALRQAGEDLEERHVALTEAHGVDVLVVAEELGPERRGMGTAQA